MASIAEQLRALLDDTAFRVLESLAGAGSPVSGRALARALNVSPTTALAALALLKKAGFAVSQAAGRSALWRLDESNPTIQRWLEEASGTTRNDAPGQRPQLTVVIFTALGLEYAAVTAYLPGRRPARVRTTRCETDIFAGDHADWIVYVAEVGAGNMGTAVEVTSAVLVLDPHLVLFVGVAGSVKPKDLCRGDVIVADRVYNLHSGKDTWTEAAGSVHLPRPVSFPAAHGAVQLARAVRRRPDWVSEFAPEAQNAEGELPRVEIKPIAAGEVVHGDDRSSLMGKVRDHLGDVAAVDMESLGLYEAAHREDFPALTVRGISDCVGDKQPDSDSQWQPRAARHAAAFAFALLCHAEPEDFPRRGGKSAPTGGTPTENGLSPAEMLLHLPPPVAVAFEWALPVVGNRATALLEEFTTLAGQPATWLSRFRHRPPPQFRDEASQPLWVLAAEFADSHEHPTASWLYEQAAAQSQDAVLSAYLYCHGAVAASRDRDPGNPEELLERAEITCPAGRLLWAYFRTAISSDVPAVRAATLPITNPLDLTFPQQVLDALGAGSDDQPDEDFRAFTEDLAERYPVFMEQTRLTVALATALIVRATPGQISTAQLLLEDLASGLPAYRGSRAGASTLRALVGSRSSNILLELARTLCMRVADFAAQDMSFDRDEALARAEELAQTARDRRQDWGGPSGEALAVAAHARAASGDIRGALRLLLPPPAGTAEAAEAASQPVVLAAAELAVGTGDIDLALEIAAKIDASAERKLATALALTLREDSRPESAAEYRALLEELATSAPADQQIRALLGLSMVTELSEGEFVRLAGLDAELADLVRAQSLLTAGQVSQAQILARRYPDSDGALTIRVNCLLNQGMTAEAIAALETHATRRRDERFLVQAALLAFSSGADDDASRLAARVASGNDPARRRIGREILIEVASRRRQWENVLGETRRLINDDAIAETDPARDASLTKYRWAQAHALYELRRMDDAYRVIRTHPRLVPADLNQARIIASVLRTIAPSVTQPPHAEATPESEITQAEVLAAVTQAAQAFPHDEELVAASVMTAFSMPAAEQPDYSLMTQARQLHQQFFDRFPDSKLIEPIPLDDELTSLKDMLRARLAPNAQAAAQMQRGVVTGQIPISVYASAFHQSYAEALIRNSTGCYVIRYPDDRISKQETDAARQALNGTVVADTSALFLATVTLGPAPQLQSYFERLLVAAPQRDDILQAQNMLMMPSAGWLGWDPASERPTFIEYDPEVTQRWSTDAGQLTAALRSCDVVADPPPPGDDDHRHRAWSSPIWVARDRGISLLADDAALRAVARNEGIAAFGSLNLLTILIEDGVLPANALDDSYRRLMEIRAADLPLLGRLRDIAAEEEWKPGGYASFLLQRPATWMPLTRGWQSYRSLMTALPQKDPETAAGWCTAAIFGLCLVTATPTVPAVAAALVVWTLLELRDPAALPLLLAGAEYVVNQFLRDADLLTNVVHRLATAVRQVTKPEMVGTVVLPLLAGLEGEAHANAVMAFFTMP